MVLSSCTQYLLSRVFKPFFPSTSTKNDREDPVCIDLSLNEPLRVVKLSY